MPRSTYYRLREKDWEEDPGDEIDEAVREEFEASAGRYGTRRIKKALARRGVTASRRRIGRSMDRQGLRSCHCDAGFRPRPSRPNEADLPNVLDREFDGHAPHTHVCSDLTYVRVGARWCYDGSRQVERREEGSPQGNRARRHRERAAARVQRLPLGALGGPEHRA